MYIVEKEGFVIKNKVLVLFLLVLFGLLFFVSAASATYYSCTYETVLKTEYNKVCGVGYLNSGSAGACILGDDRWYSRGLVNGPWAECTSYTPDMAGNDSACKRDACPDTSAFAGDLCRVRKDKSGGCTNDERNGVWTTSNKKECVQCVGAKKSTVYADTTTIYDCNVAHNPPVCEQECGAEAACDEKLPGAACTVSGEAGTCQDDCTCLGFIPEECVDQDNDGHYSLSSDERCPPSDCNDNNAGIYPGAEELCDGFDNDCDGTIDEGCDDDNDAYCDTSMGYVAVGSGGFPLCVFGDCDDEDANTFPGASERCDGKDNDCDGSYDEGCDDDNDDYCDRNMIYSAHSNNPLLGVNYCSASGDCDDFDAAVHPGEPETCDGKDNDCDGSIDEGNLCSGGQLCLYGRCSCPSGTTLCSGVCVNTNTDKDNCGSCGYECIAGRDCVNGDCVEKSSSCTPECSTKDTCGDPYCTIDGATGNPGTYTQDCSFWTCKSGKCEPSPYTVSTQCPLEKPRCISGNCLCTDTSCPSGYKCYGGNCVPVCDNDFSADAGENCENCPNDVKCSLGYNCVSGVCVGPNCGNAVTELGEKCDDGNTINTDACLSTCVAASCGDGFVRSGVEGCDDGNLVSGDGCSASCAVEAAAVINCGDGVKAGVEECDDGNTVNTDACLSTCVAASCGDGFVRSGVEGCDDGNLVSGDGCSATCTLESGVVCDFDRVCDPGENCGTCVYDCGCDYGTACINGACSNVVYPFTCGNGVCEAAESCGICPEDCKPAVDVFDLEGGSFSVTASCEPEVSAYSFGLQQVAGGWAGGYVDVSAADIAVDSSGLSHLIFLRYGGLYYVKQVANLSWGSATLINGSSSFKVFAADLALDSEDNPHIAYWKETSRTPGNNDVAPDRSHAKLFYYVGGEAELVADQAADFSTVNAYLEVSLVMDSDDAPHILAGSRTLLSNFYNAPTTSYSKLGYYVKGSVWSYKEVVPQNTESKGLSSSLDLDSADSPHIKFYGNCPTVASPCYVTLDGSSWSYLPITTALNVGSNFDLEVKNDEVYAAFVVNSVQLNVVRLDNGSWVYVVSKDTGSKYLSSPYLQIDDAGKWHLSAMEINNDDLSYAGNLYYMQDYDGYVGVGSVERSNSRNFRYFDLDYYNYAHFASGVKIATQTFLSYYYVPFAAASASRLKAYSSNPGACSQSYGDYAVFPPAEFGQNKWVCGAGKSYAEIVDTALYSVTGADKVQCGQAMPCTYVDQDGITRAIPYCGSARMCSYISPYGGLFSGRQCWIDTSLAGYTNDLGWKCIKPSAAGFSSSFDNSCPEGRWICRNCSAGACEPNPLDCSCCPSPNDCVFNQQCYSDVEEFADLVNAPSSQVTSECSNKAEDACNSKTECQFVDNACVPKTFTRKEMVNLRGDQFFETTATMEGIGVYYEDTNETTPSLEYCDPGRWYPGEVSISGRVTNVAGDAISGADVTIVGTEWSSVTVADGTYFIDEVTTGTYDIAASAPSYEVSVKEGFVVDTSKTNVNFVLERLSVLCEDDCSYTTDSTCHAECDGFNKCVFYNSDTKAACDGWPVDTRQAVGEEEALCCKGAPSVPVERQKADVDILCPQGRSPTIATTTKNVLYEGRLVKMKVLVFECS